MKFTFNSDIASSSVVIPDLSSFSLASLSLRSRFLAGRRAMYRDPSGRTFTFHSQLGSRPRSPFAGGNGGGGGA